MVEKRKNLNKNMINKKEKSVFQFETKRKESKKDSLRDDYYIIINGIADLRSYFISDSKPFIAGFHNKKVINIILNQKFKTIGKYLAKFSFDSNITNWTEEVEIEVFCDKYFDEYFPKIAIVLRVDFEDWSKAWSISEFAKELKDRIKNLKNKNAFYYQEDEEFITNGFGFAYKTELNEIAGIELEKAIKLFNEVLNDTNKSLLNKLNKDSIITYFHFPKIVQSACSQYLIYFTQFLADIGIEANTEIKEEANQTLFKITPVNKDEALEKIQDALNVYLSVPGNKNFELQIEKNDNIALKQWEANIYYLKSQLALAGSIIQAKDTTIEALKLSNYQYEQILEKGKKQSDNKEDVIKSIVSVKEYEGKGFSINLPEILRKIKRIIK
jgi:hypothetical protein